VDLSIPSAVAGLPTTGQLLVAEQRSRPPQPTQSMGPKIASYLALPADEDRRCPAREDRARSMSLSAASPPIGGPDPDSLTRSQQVRRSPPQQSCEESCSARAANRGIHIKMETNSNPRRFNFSSLIDYLNTLPPFI
jgi:hypothetical protein